MTLGRWQKFQNLDTNSLSTPGGSIFSLFSLYGGRFPRYGAISKIAIFGHDTWPLTKDSEVAHILSFYPRGSKFSLLSLYWQRFPRCGLILKITMFGHETWPLPKVPEVSHILALQTVVFKIWTDFQSCHLWALNLATGKFRSCTYSVYYPMGLKFILFSLLGQWFPS